MNLIIQGPAIQAKDAEAVAELAAAARIEPLSERAFRLFRADPGREARVRAYCESARLDYGFVPDGRTLEQFGLLVTDMDSTLITIECIDEIADMVGVKPQVAEITASAMRGEIDFAQSLTRRVALLEGLEQEALQRVYDERLRLSPGAEEMLAALKAHGVKVMLVSGGFTFFTERLKQRLGLDFIAANTLEIVDGKLTGRVLGKILDAQGKADALNRVREQLGLGQEQVIGMGDGANDLAMLAQAGVSIAYHAKPVVREKATYAINYSGLEALPTLFAPAPSRRCN